MREAFQPSIPDPGAKDCIASVAGGEAATYSDTAAGYRGHFETGAAYPLTASRGGVHRCLQRPEQRNAFRSPSCAAYCLR